MVAGPLKEPDRKYVLQKPSTAASTSTFTSTITVFADVDVHVDVIVYVDGLFKFNKKAMKRMPENVKLLLSSRQSREISQRIRDSGHCSSNPARR
jgi:hypothetical protein